MSGSCDDSRVAVGCRLMADTIPHTASPKDSVTEMTTRSQLESALIASASNYSWTWDPSTQDLFAQLPEVTAGLHPKQRVLALTDHDYDGYLADGDFIAAGQAAVERIPVPDLSPSATIAYFSPEFGVSASS